eukprot:SAG11_NODE_1892_length_4103_cov_2.029720_2_plen_200_part_00
MWCRHGLSLLASASGRQPVLAHRSLRTTKWHLDREKPTTGTYAVVQWGEEQTLVSTDVVEPGQVVYSVPFTREALSSRAGRHTVQIGKAQHLDFDIALPSAAMTHHECDPNGNLRITDASASFVARRRIEPHEILSFDYNTTEWEMESPFACQCGAPNCTGLVGGFKLLSSPRQAEIATRCSAVVLDLASEAGICLIAR